MWQQTMMSSVGSFRSLCLRAHYGWRRARPGADEQLPFFEVGRAKAEIIWIRVWLLRWSARRATSTADRKRMRSLVPRPSTLWTEVLSAARLCE
jgi:hypothetical protein